MVGGRQYFNIDGEKLILLAGVSGRAMRFRVFFFESSTISSFFFRD
jgi:hypothetical protein